MVNFTILAGTYTAAISVLNFNSAASTLSLVRQVPAGSNSSWIALSPDGKSLFATQENEPAGGVLTFAVGSGGALHQVSSAPSQGEDPAHLLPLSDRRTLIVSDYTTGGLIAFPVTGATLGTPGPLLTLHGSGPNAVRQANAHPHEIVELPGELLVPDLGSDKVWRVTREKNNVLSIAGSIGQKAGSGPRHLVVHGGSLYVLHELDNTLTQQTLPPLGTTAKCCSLPRLLANVSVAPTDGPAGSVFGAAELLRSPEGLLYASNRDVGTVPDPRGDSIAILETVPRLRLLRQVHTGLQQLRGVSLHGDFVIAAGLVGGGVAVFERVDGGRDLKLRARYIGPGSERVASFVWL